MAQPKPDPFRSKKSTGQCMDDVIQKMSRLTAHYGRCDSCTRGSGIALGPSACKTGHKQAFELTMAWRALLVRLPMLAEQPAQMSLNSLVR